MPLPRIIGPEREYEMAWSRVTTATLDTTGRLDTAASTGTLPIDLDYDGFGRLQEVEQGARATSYDYHTTSGYLETITNAAAEVTTFVTDDVGRITDIENAEGHRCTGSLHRRCRESRISGQASFQDYTKSVPSQHCSLHQWCPDNRLQRCQQRRQSL